MRRQIEQLNSQISGWRQSLGNPQLDRQLRSDLESSWATALEDRRALEQRLAAIEADQKLPKELLDPRHVLQCLGKLDQVLAEGSPTAINVALSRHIESIQVYPDGSVQMQTSPIGCFEGLVETLTRTCSSPDAELAPGELLVPARRRVRRATECGSILEGMERAIMDPAATEAQIGHNRRDSTGFDENSCVT